MATHSFFIEDLGPFLANLEARGYTHVSSEGFVVYSKTLSGALTKHYAYRPANEHPLHVQVTYELIKSGAPLQKLSNQLAILNLQYRQTLPVWKTKPQASTTLQHSRSVERDRFL